MSKILIMIILVLLSVLDAKDGLLSIDNKHYSYQNFNISYLKDDDSLLNFDDIKQKKFTQKSNSAFSLGYTKGNLWIKFDLVNSSDTKEFILTLNETFYEKANLYFKSNDRWIKKENGLFSLVKDREVKYNKLSFLLDLQTNKKQTIYLELQGKYSYFGNIEIIKKEFFKTKQFLNMDIAFIFIFGVTFIMFIFSMGMYIMLREKIYVFYGVYSFLNFFYLLNISGLLVYFDLQKHIYTFQSVGAFLLGFLLLFSIEYLNVKKYLSRYYKTIKLICVPYFLLGIILIFEYQPWNQILNFMAEFITLFLIVLSIVIYFKGHKKSKYYTFAMVLYLFFVVLFLFMLSGVMEYDSITRYSLMIGSAVENIIFSFLIISRYNDLKNSVQERLEEEVDQRTKDIQKINTKLELSIKERELLLRELYHRVKNNFHIITAILWLEGNKNKENKACDKLINRIESMSLVHEYLYNSKNLDDVDIKEVFSNIVKNITIDSSKISINENYSLDIAIDLQHALSLGMILNELVTNSIKHNFDLQNLEIKIELYNQNSRVFLNVKDNGVGYFENVTEGIGLNLVKDFCTNLPDAKYKFFTDKGAIFILDYEEKIKEL